MANGNGKKRSRRRRARRTRNNAQGPSLTPANTLKRKFRYMINFSLNNTTGSGDDAYAYYSKMIKFNPEEAYGFRDAKKTFELWRMNRAKVWCQMGYNSYNSTYNSINLDAAISSTIWTAADLGVNETISGVDLLSYDNARFHTLSLNKYVPIVNTATRLNQTAGAPIAIFPGSTWLDTSMDMNNIVYNGFQIFAMMPGVSSTNWLPKYQMIVEIECEFKQPAWQNISSSFEAEALGSILVCEITDSESRTYVLDKYNRTAQDGATLHFVRQDGQPGSLTYDVADFHAAWASGKNVGYFGERPISYTGPVPPRM